MGIKGYKSDEEPIKILSIIEYNGDVTGMG